MKIRVLILASAIVVAAWAGTPAFAIVDCNGNITDVGGALYIDDRGEGDVWIYAESGDKPGYQSGGTHQVFGYSDDCEEDGSDILLY